MTTIFAGAGIDTLVYVDGHHRGNVGNVERLRVLHIEKYDFRPRMSGDQREGMTHRAVSERRAINRTRIRRGSLIGLCRRSRYADVGQSYEIPFGCEHYTALTWIKALRGGGAKNGVLTKSGKV